MPAVDDDVPRGYLREVVTWLQMCAPPPWGKQAASAGCASDGQPTTTQPATRKAYSDNADGDADDVVLRAAPKIEPAVYRDLYQAVGEPWLWHERRRFDDATLSAILHHPQVHISVLYCGGDVAGFAELDARDTSASDTHNEYAEEYTNGDVELAYFGLLPQYCGRGLGSFMLQRIVAHAWHLHAKRLWVHTCNLDASAALGLYQKNSFTIYKQQTRIIKDPRAEGILPSTAAPHIPLRLR